MNNTRALICVAISTIFGVAGHTTIHLVMNIVWLLIAIAYWYMAWKFDK